MSSEERKGVDNDRIITLGIPLPKVTEFNADVPYTTRKAIDDLKKHSQQCGLNVWEDKAAHINVTKNHNTLAQNMIGDWLLIVGSDHTFSPDALKMLWDAAHEEPYPKIIGGISVYRSYPNKLVAANLNDTGEQMFSLTPYIDYHPGEMMIGSGEVRKVDALGSGFCMYHRSVFDTIPYPWFQHCPQPIPHPRLVKFLRAVIAGENTDDMKDEARAFLAMSRRPNPIGPDYWFNLNARNYGFDTFVHWGVTVLHWDWEAKHPAHYTAWVTSDPKHIWAEMMEGIDLTTQAIQEIKQRYKDKNVEKLLGMNPQELLVDYAQESGKELTARDLEMPYKDPEPGDSETTETVETVI